MKCLFVVIVLFAGNAASFGDSQVLSGDKCSGQVECKNTSEVDIFQSDSIGGVRFGSRSILPSIKPRQKIASAPFSRKIVIDGRGGDRPEIGLFTEWQSEFLATGKNRALIIAQADSMLDLPWCDFDIMKPPYWNGGKYSLSFSHTPNLFFLPYLLTNDPKYVAPMECQYQIFHEWFKQDPAGKPMPWLTGRDMAWQLRNLGELAFLEQQGATKKRIYIDALERTRRKILRRMSLPFESEFHVLGENQLGNAHQWSGWFESFIGMTVNHIVDLGFTKWLPVANWHFQHLLDRCGRKWPIKACDNDHVTLVPAHSTWENTPPYSPERTNCYLTAPDEELMPFKCDGVFMTYADRAQMARSWAAMAAGNGIDGAAELYQTLDVLIKRRPGTAWYKYSITHSNSDRLVTSSPESYKLATAQSSATPRNSRTGLLSYAPPGKWMEIPDSRISDVLPPESFKQPIHFISGPKAITGAWNGAVFNSDRQSLDIFSSGGHADYCGNEYLSFSLETLQWRLIHGPSDLNNFDLKSGTVVGADPPLQGIAPDGRPVSRHTYGGQVYHRGLKKSFMFGGSLCSGAGSGDDRWWSATPDGKYELLGGDGSWAPLGWSAAYEPNSENIFLSRGGNVYEYDVAGNAFLLRTNFGSSGQWGQSLTIDSSRRIAFGFGHYNPDKSYSRAFSYNIQTGEHRYVDLTGDLSIIERPGIGLEYVSELDVYVAWIGGSSLYFIDPEKFHVTRVEMKGSPPPATSNGVYGRFSYSADFRGFIVVSQIDENVFFLKLPDYEIPLTTLP